jgi:hypothetical protein
MSHQTLSRQGGLTWGSQADVVRPRLMKLPGATDEENEKEEQRYAQQKVLIAKYKKENPDASVNRMFEDLGAQFPNLFTDHAFIGPQDDI